MKKAKIIIVERKGANSVWGVMNPIAEALVNRGDEVFFCRWDDTAQRHSLPVPRGVNVIDIEVPSKRYIWDLYTQNKKFSRKFREVADKIKPDIVHTNFAVSAIPARCVARQLKVPVVLSTQHEKYNSMYLHFRMGLRATEKLVDSFVYVSKTVEESFVLGQNLSGFEEIEGGFPRHSVIYNGIDAEVIRSAVSKSIKKKKNKLVCVGRLTSVKGQKILLQAMPKILVSHPDTKLALIGGGEDEVFLRNLAGKLGITGNVQFLEWGAHEDAIRAIAEAEALVAPSTNKQEGFGLVVAEAMALGTPIAASRIDVFKEILGEDDSCGWFFGSDDPGSLADAVNRIFSRRDDAAVRANKAFLRVNIRFSAKRMVTEYLMLYDALIAHKR